MPRWDLLSAGRKGGSTWLCDAQALSQKFLEASRLLTDFLAEVVFELFPIHDLTVARI